MNENINGVENKEEKDIVRPVNNENVVNSSKPDEIKMDNTTETEKVVDINPVVNEGGKFEENNLEDKKTDDSKKAANQSVEEPQDKSYIVVVVVLYVIVIILAVIMVLGIVKQNKIENENIFEDLENTEEKVEDNTEDLNNEEEPNFENN